MLKLPVQVSVTGSEAGIERQRLEDLAEEAEHDTNATFEPRSMSVHVAAPATEDDRPPAYFVPARESRQMNLPGYI